MSEFRIISVLPSETWIVQMRVQPTHRWKDWTTFFDEESATICCKIANLLFVAFPCLKCRRKFLWDIERMLKDPAPPTETPDE